MGSFGAILGFVRIGMQVAHGQTPPSPFYRPRQAAACKTVCAPSLLYIEGYWRKVEIWSKVSYVCESTPMT